jgi:hypothetical protein
MKPSTLPEAFALELMRKGRPLQKMHTVNGMRWFIVPGGQVTDDVAAAYWRAAMCSRATEDCFPGVSRPFNSAAAVPAE